MQVLNYEFLAHFHNITFSKHGGDENRLCSGVAEIFLCLCTLKCQFDGCWIYIKVSQLCFVVFIDYRIKRKLLRANIYQTLALNPMPQFFAAPGFLPLLLECFLDFLREKAVTTVTSSLRPAIRLVISSFPLPIPPFFILVCLAGFPISKI